MRQAVQACTEGMPVGAASSVYGVSTALLKKDLKKKRLAIAMQLEMEAAATPREKTER